jgi:hypothetical protein
MAVLLSAGLSIGVSGGPAAAAAPEAVVRAAHFSPTTPGVDVYLGSFSGGPSRLWLSSVTYGAVSPYQKITPGLYTVSMRPAGADPSTAPVLSWTLDARADSAYTVAGVGADASVRGIVITDDLSSPAAGQGRLRVVQAASRAPTATVTASNGTVIAQDAAFATTTPYTEVPAGDWTLSAVGSGGTQVQTSSAIEVTPGVSTSVLLLDDQTTGITLRTVLDSSSSGTAPDGSVPAGGGGTAAGQHSATLGTVGIAAMAATAGLAAALAALVLGAGSSGPVWRRRRQPARVLAGGASGQEHRPGRSGRS